jgi:hypothetical protein
MLRTRTIAITALAIIGALAPVASGAKRKKMSDINLRAAALLAEFNKERNPERLQEAANLLIGVDLSQEAAGTKRLTLRRETLQLWLAILATIDKNLDPAFDANDRPLVSVSPPPGPAGQYPPGVDPSLIADPNARKQYEDAIRKNSDKASRYRVQAKLRRVESKIMPMAERFIRMSYTTAAGDQRDLNETVKKTIANSQRASALLRAGVPKN